MKMLPALPSLTRRSRHLLAAAGLLALATGCAGSAAEGPSLEISRVVLYQSGVGYVERTGELDGSTLLLHVRPDQINDIMASLVVRDVTHNDLASISLPLDAARIPQPSPLPPELQGGSGLMAALRALIGAEVTVRTHEGASNGRILGTESTGTGDEVLTLVTGEGRLKAIKVATVTSVDLHDTALSDGLNRSLDASLSSGDWKSVEVTIRFPSDEAREVALAYLVEMPTWRPIYRAIVSDGKLRLDGYAIVDNTSGEAWENVNLSLTAGTPISFKMDLRTPVQPQRPDMTGYGLLDQASMAPPPPMAARGMAAAMAMPMQEALDNYEYDAPGAAVMQGRAYGGAPMAKGMGRMAAPPAVFGGEELPSAEATGADMGALFRYDIPVPISVANGASVLVPIVHAMLDGADALVFEPGNGAASQVHPYRALHIKNTGKTPIQPAPITVYSDSAYAGSAVAPYIGLGQSAVVPFGIESDVSVSTTTNDHRGAATLIKMDGGNIYAQSEYTVTDEVSVDSALPDGAKLFVKVARRQDYDLKLPDGATKEDHPGFYLVALPVTKAGASTFEIEQSTRSTTTLAINAAELPDLIGAYLSGGKARPEVTRQLQELNNKLREMATINTGLDSIRQLRADLQNRTQELRQNLAAIGTSTTNADLRQTLLDRLANSEKELEKLVGRLVEGQERSSRLRIEASELLKNIKLGE